MATLLEAAGVDRVLAMDLHQGQMQGFFEIPVDHMTATPMLADYFRYKGFGDAELVAVSADAGGVKLAKRFASRIDGRPGGAHQDAARAQQGRDDALHRRRRRQDRHPHRRHDRHRRLGRRARSTRSTSAARKRSTSPPRTRIFSGPARERIAQSPVKEIVVTDTLPVTLGKDDTKIKVLSVAGILADTIKTCFRRRLSE